MAEDNILDTISKERVLRNAHAHLKHRYRNVELWSFVQDVCATGATYSMLICRELGWNPHAKGSDALPAWTGN